MKFLAEIGDKNAFGLVLILQKHFRPDKECITTVIVVGFVTLFNSLDKMFWRDPRPFFIMKMTPLYCKETDYGNPSGHAMLTVAIFMTVFQLAKKKGALY